MEAPTMETAPGEEETTENDRDRNVREYGEFLFTIYPEPKAVQNPDEFWRDMPA